MFGATSGPKDWPGSLYLHKKEEKLDSPSFDHRQARDTRDTVSAGTLKLRNGPWTEGIKLMGLPDDADAK